MKVILLGLPKCGTMSFTESLNNIGYKPIHYTNDKGELAAELVLKAIRMGKPLLHFIEDYNCVTQMDAIIPSRDICFFPQSVFYRRLYDDYPNALFILNKRNVDNHVKSIQNWGDMEKRFNHFGVNNLNEFITLHNKTIEMAFGRCNNFLSFNIEEANPDELKKFIHKDFKLFHINKTNQ